MSMLKTRNAGKNQLFWGVIFLATWISMYGNRIMGDDLNGWYKALCVFSFVMFFVKGVDWEDVKERMPKICCDQCHSQMTGMCTDKGCPCHRS